MAGLMSTSVLQKTWGKDFTSVAFDEFVDFPKQSPATFNKMDATKDEYIRRGKMVSLGSAIAMDQGTPVPYDQYADGPEKIVYPAKFGLQVAVTDEARQTDRIKIYAKILPEIGKSVAYTMETQNWDVLNSGFGTTRIGIDGLALFSASHPLYGVPGSVYSNLHSGSLSKTTLETAINKFTNMVNDRNRPVIVKPMKLYIHPNLEWKAKELLLSPDDPESANRNINPLYKSLTYECVRFLTSTTAWFIGAAKADHDLQSVMFTNPHYKEYRTENIEATNYLGSYRMLSTFWDWQGWVGSPGT